MNLKDFKRKLATDHNKNNLEAFIRKYANKCERLIINSNLKIDDLSKNPAVEEQWADVMQANDQTFNHMTKKDKNEHMMILLNWSLEAVKVKSFEGQPIVISYLNARIKSRDQYMNR